jgi:hypothetical protein
MDAPPLPRTRRHAHKQPKHAMRVPADNDLTTSAECPSLPAFQKPRAEPAACQRSNWTTSAWSWRKNSFASAADVAGGVSDDQLLDARPPILLDRLCDALGGADDAVAGTISAGVLPGPYRAVAHGTVLLATLSGSPYGLIFVQVREVRVHFRRHAASLTPKRAGYARQDNAVLIADARMDVQFEMTQLANGRATQPTNKPPDAATETGPALAEIDERLHAEFRTRISRARISAVVRQADNDLSGAPTGALPELVERLARQRLNDLLSQH